MSRCLGVSAITISHYIFAPVEYQPRQARDFEKLRENGLLLPGVNQPEDYDSILARDFLKAGFLALCTDQLVPTPELARRIHAVMFARVYPFAGEFRTAADPVPAIGGQFAARPERIGRELELWQAQTHDILAAGDAGAPLHARDNPPGAAPPGRRPGRGYSRARAR